MRHASIIPTLTIALSVSVVACEPDEVTDVSPEASALMTSGTTSGVIGADDLEASDTESRLAGFTSLATVVAPGGAVVEFRRLGTGQIAVSELVRTGELSPTNALLTARRATPLELFLAIAPPDRAVPVELEEAHRAYATANQLDPAPRRLSLNANPVSASLDGKYSSKYVADCDLPDDRAWFDSIWQFWGFDWHWYDRSNAYNGWSPATPKTEGVASHLCNDGPSGSKIHRVRRSSCGSTSSWDYVFTTTVPPEHRSYFGVYNGPSVLFPSPHADMSTVAATRSGARTTRRTLTASLIQPRERSSIGWRRRS